MSEQRAEYQVNDDDGAEHLSIGQKVGRAVEKFIDGSFDVGCNFHCEIDGTPKHSVKVHLTRITDIR